MPYIRSDGSVTNTRTWFRLSIFSDLFWSVVNVIGLFFDSLINPKKPIKKRDYEPRVAVNSGGGGGGGGGGDGGGRKGGDGGGNRNGPRNGGHNNPRPFGANIRTLPRCAPSG